jgi:hypothetical protein
VLGHAPVHLGRRSVLQSLPAEVFVRKPLGVLSFGEDPSLDGLAEPGRLALLQLLDLVEPLQKEKVGNLFDDIDRVGNAP